MSISERKPHEIIEIVHGTLLWIAMFSAEKIAAFVLRNTPQTEMYYFMTIGMTGILCLVIPILGKRKLDRDIQEICLYDFLVQIFGLILYTSSFSVTPYIVLAQMITVLKILRLGWPIFAAHKNYPPYWPTFGVLGAFHSRKQPPIFSKELSKIDIQRAYRIMVFIPMAALLIQQGWVYFGFPLPDIATILFIFCITSPLITALETRENERKLAWEEAARAKAAEHFATARLKDQQIIEAQNAELAASNRRLGQLNATLKNRNAELQALYEERDEMAQTLAARNDRLGDAIHDQKNNSIVMGFRAKQLRESAVNEDQHETATLLFDEVEDLSRNLMVILHAARLENHFPKRPGKQIMVAKSVCHYLFERLNPIALQHEVTLRCHYPQSDEPLAIETDEDIFKRIIINLLLNAINYAGPNRDACITFYGGPDGCYVHVYDNGPGMAGLDGPDRVENFDILIERVAQAHVLRENQNTDPLHPTNGNGVGLLNVSRLCHDLGVVVKLRSRLGHGTDFCLKFPLAVPELPTDD